MFLALTGAAILVCWGWPRSGYGEILVVLALVAFVFTYPYLAAIVIWLLVR